MRDQPSLFDLRPKRSNSPDTDESQVEDVEHGDLSSEGVDGDLGLIEVHLGEDGLNEESRTGEERREDEGGSAAELVDDRDP